jgi:hypothetical protein
VSLIVFPFAGANKRGPSVSPWVCLVPSVLIPGARNAFSPN